MKYLKIIFAFLLITANITSIAQHINRAEPVKTKVFAVVTGATWCEVCMKHGERAAKAIMNYQGKGLSMIGNNVTNDSTKAVSKKVLMKEGLYVAIAGDKEVGVVTFIDAKTKKKIKQLSLSLTNEELKNEIEEILKKGADD